MPETSCGTRNPASNSTSYYPPTTYDEKFLRTVENEFGLVGFETKRLFLTATRASVAQFRVFTDRRLRCITIIISQHPAESVATSDLTVDLADFVPRVDDFVV